MSNPRWFIWSRRWAMGVRLGTLYLHMRRPDSPPLYSERYGDRCWFCEALGWRFTVRWGCPMPDLTPGPRWRRCWTLSMPRKHRMNTELTEAQRADIRQMARDVMADKDGLAQSVEVGGQRVDVRLNSTRRISAEYDVSRECPVCSGDCSAANPPVMACPMHTTR